MSSGTAYQPGRVRKLLDGLTARLESGQPAQRQGEGSKAGGVVDIERIRRLGMSPRQQRLNHLFAWYRCAHYDTRKIDWNGQEVTDPIEHEAIATAGFIPPGFYDASATLPIKFRRPSAPYALVKVIVDRFTALLFSEHQHPHVYVDGDEDTDDYVEALVETARLWPEMLLARQYGGAMGTVCMGFQFLEGKPVVEVHDPRWVTPVFEDRASYKLKSMEKRYMYPMDERDEEGRFVTVWYWYRRTIDKNDDVLYKPAPVGNGEEPEWQEERRVSHGLGVCPIVWAQNLPASEDIDGDPDCLGVYDLVESIDMLIAQANKGVISNCDPTVRLISQDDFPEIRKGSDNAIKLTEGSVDYMELSGTGPKAALELADVLRKYALEVAQCVLEHPEMSVRTATEIERVYSSMLAKADTLREQYGHRLILPLVAMMLGAARNLNESRVGENGNIERHVLVLPQKVVRNAKGNMSLVDRKLGEGGVLGIRWPRYFQQTLADIELAVRAAGEAQAGNLLDLEHAVRFTSEYFGIEDTAQLTEKLLKKQQEQAEQQKQMAMGGAGGFGGGGGAGSEGPYGYEEETEE